VIVDYLGNRYASYDAFLRGRIWRIRRGRWLRDKRPYCRACRRKGRLDVHHLEHPEGMLGNEPDDCLIALCHGRRCHFMAHRYFEGGRHESMRAATYAFIADS
jgi:hypothetical protein